MLLIIENKNAPTEPIIEDSGKNAEILYIRSIAVPVENDFQQVQRKNKLDCFCFSCRNTQGSEQPQGEKLVSQYLRAVGHIGEIPGYLSPVAAKACGFSEEAPQYFCEKG
jgi:hypothetical protein